MQTFIKSSPFLISLLLGLVFYGCNKEESSSPSEATEIPIASGSLIGNDWTFQVARVDTVASQQKYLLNLFGTEVNYTSSNICDSIYRVDRIWFVFSNLKDTTYVLNDDPTKGDLHSVIFDDESTNITTSAAIGKVQIDSIVSDSLYGVIDVTRRSASQSFNAYGKFSAKLCMEVLPNLSL